MTPAGDSSQRRPDDRWGPWLLWAAALLVAAAAALGADLLFWPPAGSSTVQATNPAHAAPELGASLGGGTAHSVGSNMPAGLALAITRLLEVVKPSKRLPIAPLTLPTLAATALVAESSPAPAHSLLPLPLVTAAPSVAALPGGTAIPSSTLGPPPTGTPTAATSPTPTNTPIPSATAPATALSMSEARDLLPPGSALDARPFIVPEQSLAQAMTPRVTPPGAPTPGPRGAFQVDILNRYLNIVVLGSDKRVRSSTWRTDAIVVVSVDLEDHVVRLLSIPRDLWVYIPGHGYNRINTADLWGTLAKKGDGPEWVKQTIYYNLGIPIHYYFRVGMSGFVDIIDTVGGVEVDVDCPLPDINLKPGIHHMDGKQALAYARSRKSTNDFDRGRRQRKVLLALWDQALTWDTIPKLPQLWTALSDGFETDLPLSQVVNLAYVGVQIKPQRILSSAIRGPQVRGWTTPQGAQVLVPREEKIRDLLEDFYARKDLAELDAASGVRVQILNGTQRKDAEALAAAAVQWAGFKVVDKGLAESRSVAKTEIRVYQGDLAMGQQVALALRVPTTAVRDWTTADDGLPGKAVIQVRLGADYNPCQR
jgi:polyisoprenyl-teichoic acid--peptidoglycan teichoic acid transferase